MGIEVKFKEDKKNKGSFTVTVKGTIDYDTYRVFEEKMRFLYDKVLKHVAFDMEEVTYVSSAGLGVVFVAMKKIKDKGGDIAFQNLQPSVKKLFEIFKESKKS